MKLWVMGVVLLCVIILTTFLAGGGDFTPPAPTPLPRQPHYVERLYSGGLDAIFPASQSPSSSPAPTVPPSRPRESLTKIEALVCSYDWPCDQALAVMYCESEGLPTAYNPSGASGLFQIMRRWHEWRVIALGYTWDDIFIPEVNIAVAYHIWADSGWSLWDCRYAAYG